MAVSRLKKKHLFKNTVIINKKYYAVHKFFFCCIGKIWEVRPRASNYSLICPYVLQMRRSGSYDQLDAHIYSGQTK